MEQKDPASLISGNQPQTENEKTSTALENGPSDTKPKIIGSYRLIKTIASDGFGKLKLAEHVVTGQKVSCITRNLFNSTHPHQSGISVCYIRQECMLQVRLYRSHMRNPRRGRC